MNLNTPIDVNYEVRTLSYKPDHEHDPKQVVAACGFFSNLQDSFDNKARFVFIPVEPMRRPVVQEDGREVNHLIWAMQFGEEEQANPDADTVMIQSDQYLPQLFSYLAHEAQETKTAEPSSPISPTTENHHSAADHSPLFFGHAEEEPAPKPFTEAQPRVRYLPSHSQGNVNALQQQFALEQIRAFFIGQSGKSTYGMALNDFTTIAKAAMGLAIELNKISKNHSTNLDP